MVDDNSHAVWSGEFDLGGVKMKCHTLSDGRRIIEQESVLEFFAAVEAGLPLDAEAVQAFGRWQRGGH